MSSAVLRCWGLLATLGAVSACAVDPVDLSGKACPCAGEYTCVQGVCVRGGVDGGLQRDSGPDPEADAGPDCGSPGVYRIERFEAGWRTEGSLGWRWVTAADARGTDLLRYTVVLGPDAPSVEACACALGRGAACEDGVRVLDERTNPELAHDTRSNQTGGPEPVRSTVSAGLEADTVYAAALLAFDTRGGASRSSVALNRTTRPALRARTVFDGGAIGAGYTIPGCFEVGAEGYRYRVSCPPPLAARGGCRVEEDPCTERWPGTQADDWLCESEVHPEHEATCWVTLRWQELDLPIDVPSGAFDEAYLEIALAIDGTPANYGEAYILVGGGDGGSTSYGIRTGEVALRAGAAQHLYRLPLGAMTREDGAHLEGSALRDGRLDRVSLGAIFAHGTTIHVSRVAIRY